MKNLTIIAALSENNTIGLNGKLPWYLPEDLKHFKELTLDNSIIMGRKTYESIGKPLPKRENIIITKNLDYKPEKILIAHSIQEAIEKATKEKIFCIGGAEIYRQVLPFANKLELTMIDGNYNGDVFFPPIDYSQWNLTKQDTRKDFSFLTFERT